MRRFLSAITFLIIVESAMSITPVFCQSKKDLTISIGTGIFNSPYYTNARIRPFYNFDFDYNINERHKISTNFIAGKHLYYDSIFSNNAVPLNTPGYEDNANSSATYKTFSLLYKYQLLNSKKFSLNVGLGAGFMIQILEYPYTEGNIVDFRETLRSDFVFPTRLEIDYKLSRHFQLGIMCGLFIVPDYPVLGYHIGPRLGYGLK